MEYSYFLAKVMGLYFVIVSLGLALNMKSVPAVFTDMMKNAALHLTIALNILVIGVLLVVTHNVWIADWEVLITILSWLILIKGVLNLAFPQMAYKIAKPFIASKPALYTSIIINLLIGIYLCYMGFFSADSWGMTVTQ